ncbi:MAG: hypothetical protein ABFS56_21610 [Pseudomonadota bacterium]
MDSISQRLTGRIKELAERYGETLPQLDWRLRWRSCLRQLRGICRKCLLSKEKKLMPRVQIKKVGNSAALLLNEEIMKLLAIHIGDEVDVKIEKNNLIIQLDDFAREQKLKKVTTNVFERRKSAYQKLAKGVS